MVAEIKCDEAGTCRFQREFGKMAALPHDLIPFSRAKTSKSASVHKRVEKKQIKRRPKGKSASATLKAKPRGRPPKTTAQKPKKRVSAKPNKKQVKPKPRGRPPSKK